MDTQALVTNADPLEVGRAATKAMLADAEFKLCLAMWWRDVDTEEWRFVVSTPVYEQWGAQKAYLRVRKILEENDLLESLMLEKVWILPPSHPIINAVGTLVSGENIRIAGLVVNGTAIDDMYVFYSQPRTNRRKTKKRTTPSTKRAKRRRNVAEKRKHPGEKS